MDVVMLVLDKLDSTVSAVLRPGHILRDIAQDAWHGLTGWFFAPSTDDQHNIRPGLVGTSLPDGFERVWQFQDAKGQSYTARRLQPGDIDRLVQDFGRLSVKSRFNRYLSVVNHLSGPRLHSLVDTDQPQHVVLGVICDGPGAPESVGVVRYWRLQEDGPEAEFAITLMDDWQGQGLGKTLMLLLMQVAADNGIERLVGDVHYENYVMKGLLRSLGAQGRHGDAGADHFVLPVCPDSDDIDIQLHKRLPAFRQYASHITALPEYPLS